VASRTGLSFCIWGEKPQKGCAFSLRGVPGLWRPPPLVPVCDAAPPWRPGHSWGTLGGPQRRSCALVPAVLQAGSGLQHGDPLAPSCQEPHGAYVAFVHLNKAMVCYPKKKKKQKKTVEPFYPRAELWEDTHILEASVVGIPGPQSARWGRDCALSHGIHWLIPSPALLTKETGEQLVLSHMFWTQTPVFSANC